MIRRSHENMNTIDRVGHLLEATMAIGVEDLEQLVQQAHECDTWQMDDPAEVFGVSRQALRMFWHFRRNLEAIPSVRAANE